MPRRDGVDGAGFLFLSLEVVERYFAEGDGTNGPSCAAGNRSYPPHDLPNSLRHVLME